MAIGGYTTNSTSSEGNSSKVFEGQYYSRLKIRNQDGKLNLSISYKSGLMIFDISEQRDGFKYESLCNIHLSPTKAGLFAKEIGRFIDYYNKETIIPGKAFGVNAGMSEKISYIGIHASKDKDILLTIGKVDPSGSITDQATMALNRDYHYSLEWDNIENMSVSKVYHDETELDQLIAVLEDFSRSMSGAFAYSVLDLGRFDTAKALKRFDPIYDKLGIERHTNNGYSSNRGTNNFFNNSGTKESAKTSIDELEGMFEDD